MSQATLRIVKAPNQWHCQCGREIPASQQCAKLGSRVLCLECLMAGLPPRPAPKPLTKAQRQIAEAHFLALDAIADLTHFVEGDDALLIKLLRQDIAEIENELGLRGMPYHGRAHNVFEGINIHQLDAMISVYTEFLLREG